MRSTESDRGLLILDIQWPPETFLRRKIEGLVSKGWRISVAAAVPFGRRTFRMKGVRLVQLSHPDDPTLIRAALLLVYGFRLLRYGSKGIRWVAQLDVFRQGLPLKYRMAVLLQALILLPIQPSLVHFEWPTAAILYKPLVDLWGCPFVVSCRGRQINVMPHLPNQEKYVSNLKAVLTQAAVVHCVSSAIQKEVVKLGARAEATRVIRPAVDVSFFEPGTNKRNDKNGLIVTSVGTLTWVKGYEYALSAIRRLIDWEIPVRYNIIGDGPDRKRIQFAIDDLGLGDCVRLAGKLPPSAVLAQLQETDVFVLSSLSEGIANSVLEAMACGIPIVTTGCGGMVEAVTDGVEGLVVPARDPEALANAVRQLWTQPQKRRSMGEAGRKRILAEFDATKQINQVIELYQSLLIGRNGLDEQTAKAFTS